MNPGPEEKDRLDKAVPAPKCCPYHLRATNRAERRDADRQCPTERRGFAKAAQHRGN